MLMLAPGKDAVVAEKGFPKCDTSIAEHRVYKALAAFKLAQAAREYARQFLRAHPRDRTARKNTEVCVCEPAGVDCRRGA